MNRKFWKEFLDWLDTASMQQLQEAANRADLQMTATTDRSIQEDLRRMVRWIEEEMAIRQLPLQPTDRDDQAGGPGH